MNTICDEAYQVLKEAGQPLHLEQLYDGVVAREKFVPRAPGRERALKSFGLQIRNEIRTKGTKSRFVRVARATYGLREWEEAVPTAASPSAGLTAEGATEVALAFLKKHYKFIPQEPVKAVRENNVWLVEIDVGLLKTRIASIKIDSATGDILEYSIPASGV